MHDVHLQCVVVQALYCGNNDDDDEDYENDDEKKSHNLSGYRSQTH
jgi:hypothetical protein